MSGKKVNLRSARRLPLLLLLLALSTVFLFGNDRGQSYQPGLHNAVSVNYLAVTANLSPEHNFLLFYRQMVDVDDLPARRKQHGFDNLDFYFDNYRFSYRDRDVAVRELPYYRLHWHPHRPVPRP